MTQLDETSSHPVRPDQAQRTHLSRDALAHRTDAAVDFADRHIGPRSRDLSVMLHALGHDSLDALVDAAVPAAIRTDRPLDLPAARGEEEVLSALRDLASRNTVLTSMIGQGYSGTRTPGVIRRNVLESPAWYTAYTPYQPEISQGRLEALLNFQTVVADLTGLPVANASLLDEATAVTEAVLLMRRATKGRPGGVVVLDADCLPQTIAVARGRAEAMGLPLVVADLADGIPAGLGGEDGVIGVVLQQPGASGVVRDLRPVVERAREAGALVTVAADLLSLTLLTPPGELGADVAVGSAQRFGVPMFHGGPHAAFMAVRTGLERTLPGRLVGVSIDADGDRAYRLALQTREQHIRREKATSNICTAQALLAVVASMYAVHHGPDGLRAIAERTHGWAVALADGLRAGGVTVEHDAFFDTVRALVPGAAQAVVTAAAGRGINLWLADADHVQVACDETTTADHVGAVLAAFVDAGAADDGATRARAASSGTASSGTVSSAGPASSSSGTALPDEVRRTSDYLTHPVFHAHRSETAMLRYLRRLSDLDLALDRTMIPLGSCTMKLNATVEMEPMSWPGFADLHPFAPPDTPSSSRAWRAGSPRSPGTRRCRCSRTRGPRASSPACSRSVRTTRPRRPRPRPRPRPEPRLTRRPRTAHRDTGRVPLRATSASSRRRRTAPMRRRRCWPGCGSSSSPPRRTAPSSSTTCARSSRSTAGGWRRS